METTTLEPILAEHPFFQGLAPEYLKLLVSCAANVRYKANEMIIRAGQEAVHFFLLRHGEAYVEIHDPRHRHVVIHKLHEGDVFGWSWMLPPYKAHFDVRANTLVRAISLDGKCLREKFDTDNSLGYQMLLRFTPLIVQRFERTSLQLLDVYS
ncbi:MAG: cyclic nucleotide-binding domain-containing protein [Chloroflexi bacterium]|nr:cyclic nucleotide-binding domain-containing protein [Chloroflexota bacterium]